MTQRCTGQTLVEHKPGKRGAGAKNKEERRADSRIALVAQAAATTDLFSAEQTNKQN